MSNRRVGLASALLTTTFFLCFLASGQETPSSQETPSPFSSKLKCGETCSSFQQSDTLPDKPAQGIIRLAVGGDSRDDKNGVIPWAFKEAKNRGAQAFFFLGDMELTAAEDDRFIKQTKQLGIPFYPAIGNHEVLTFGVLRLPKQTLAHVKKFKETSLNSPAINLAPLPDVVAYSVNLEGGIHLVALDNVSRKGEGFGRAQLTWLAEDLRAASAAKKIILVGMHKGLANNPVTSHAMDEDGRRAIVNSDSALKIFNDFKVAMVFVSHSHMYAAYTQDPGALPVRLTGGMGAPLVKGLAEADGGFHHFLLVDVTPGDLASIHVQVVKFPCSPPSCKPSVSEKDEAEETD